MHQRLHLTYRPFVGRIDQRTAYSAQDETSPAAKYSPLFCRRFLHRNRRSNLV
jgi:hypothetical protein